GREMAHQEFGMQLMEKVRDDLNGMSQVEMEPKMAGRNITMTLSPLPAARRKRRFSVPAQDVEAEKQNGSDSTDES
ncbi:MAG: translation initiation factor IF-3, partial [Chthoniobacterales bacterium]